MDKLSRTIVALGAISAATAVGMGAFAAHVLDDYLVSKGYAGELDLRLEWFETAARYQMYHSLGLLLAGVLAAQSLGVRAVSVCFLIGILLFSGSLYTMALVSGDFRWLGAVVPVGGIAFILGWITLAWQCWNRQGS